MAAGWAAVLAVETLLAPIGLGPDAVDRPGSGRRHPGRDLRRRPDRADHRSRPPDHRVPGGQRSPERPGRGPGPPPGRSVDRGQRRAGGSIRVTTSRLERPESRNWGLAPPWRRSRWLGDTGIEQDLADGPGPGHAQVDAGLPVVAVEALDVDDGFGPGARPAGRRAGRRWPRWSGSAGRSRGRSRSGRPRPGGGRAGWPRSAPSGGRCGWPPGRERRRGLRRPPPRSAASASIPAATSWATAASAARLGLGLVGRRWSGWSKLYPARVSCSVRLGRHGLG